MSQYDRLAEQNDAAIAAGNLWLQRCFPTTGLNRAVELEPEIVRSWVSNFESNPALSSRASAFYVSLVQVLVKQDDWHEAAAKIYRKLRSKSMFVRFIDGDTQLELLDTAVFEASETAPMRDLWQERYTNCKSDRDLLDFAMLVRSAEGAPSFGWLNRHLETMMISEIPFNRAKAVAMRGFIEQDMSARWMEDIPVGDSSWMNEVRSTARERARFESFARHWFERFCAADELEEAWGAYRLFLISADRRCLLWIRQLLVEPGTSHRKAAFYDTNIQDLQRTIRENEKKMDETFVNCKVDDSLGPWMRLLS